MNPSLNENVYSRNSLLFNFLIASAAFLFIYFYLILRNGLFIDELMDVTNYDSTYYTATNRYGITLFRMLASDIMAPVTYGFFSAGCIGLAIALQIQHFLVKGNRQLSAGELGCLSFFYIAIHLGIFQLLQILAFSYHADAVCCGYLLMTAGYMAYCRGIAEKQKRWFLAAITCFLLGTSTYETLLLMPLILYVADVLRTALHSQHQVTWFSLRKQSLTLGCLLTLSFILYVTGVFITKSLVAPEYIEAHSGYHKGVVAWRNTSQYGALEYLWLLLSIAKRICRALIGLEYQGNWFYATAVIPVIAILAQLRKSRGSSQQNWVTATAVLALWLLPFLPIVAVGGSIGGRILYAPPCACALLWCIYLSSNKGMLQRIPRWVFYAVSAILLTKASYAVTDYALRNKITSDTALRLIEEVKLRAWQTAVPEGVDVYTCPITIVGTYSLPPMKVRYNNFEKNPAKTCFPKKVTLHSFWASYTLNTHISTTSQLTEERLQQELGSMSIYPAKGSCRYVEGEIIVRME